MLPLPPLPEIFGNYSLKGMSEVVVPAPINWLPTTIGWKIAALICVAYLLWRGHLYLQFRRRNRYRKQALNQLEALVSDHGMSPTLLAGLSRLLKATAAHCYPRREVAKLSGDNWLQWLERHGGAEVFSTDSQQLLAYGVYQAAGTTNSDAIATLTREIQLWILHHPEADHA
jgi:hypothetical protein